jgi:hypothetical protein
MGQILVNTLVKPCSGPQPVLRVRTHPHDTETHTQTHAAKIWSNTGQMLVKRWPNTGQNFPGPRLYWACARARAHTHTHSSHTRTGSARARKWPHVHTRTYAANHRRNAGQMLVKHGSNAGQTRIQRGSDAGHGSRRGRARRPARARIHPEQGQRTTTPPPSKADAPPLHPRARPTHHLSTPEQGHLTTSPPQHPPALSPPPPTHANPHAPSGSGLERFPRRRRGGAYGATCMTPASAAAQSQAAARGGSRSMPRPLRRAHAALYCARACPCAARRGATRKERRVSSTLPLPHTAAAPHRAVYCPCAGLSRMPHPNLSRPCSAPNPLHLRQDPRAGVRTGRNSAGRKSTRGVAPCKRPGRVVRRAGDQFLLSAAVCCPSLPYLFRCHQKQFHSPVEVAYYANSLPVHDPKAELSVLRLEF